MDKLAQIAQLQARVSKYRRLAMYTNDPRTTEALLGMADEDEAEIRRLRDEKIRPEMPGPQPS